MTGITVSLPTAQYLARKSKRGSHAQTQQLCNCRHNTGFGRDILDHIRPHSSRQDRIGQLKLKPNHPVFAAGLVILAPKKKMPRRYARGTTIAVPRAGWRVGNDPFSLPERLSELGHSGNGRLWAIVRHGLSDDSRTSGHSRTPCGRRREAHQAQRQLVSSLKRRSPDSETLKQALSMLANMERLSTQPHRYSRPPARTIRQAPLSVDGEIPTCGLVQRGRRWLGHSWQHSP